MNLARFCFLDAAVDEFYRTGTTWRTQRSPCYEPKRDATPTIGNSQILSASSPLERWEFRVHWAAQDVRLHRAGTNHFRHPVFAILDVAFDSLEIPAEDGTGLTLTAYSAEPGSSSEDA